MIRALIVDDEPLARDGIRLLLQTDPDVTVVAECNNGTRAVSVLKREEIDILFLDVQMPGMNGFEVLARLPAERLPVVIFVTAYDHYALEAFKVHALDYLLKPFSDKEFLQALDRAKSYVRLQSMESLTDRLTNFLREVQLLSTPTRVDAGNIAQKDTGFVTRLGVSQKDRVLLVQVKEIDWIEAADYCVTLHVAGKAYTLRETLSNLEERLNPLDFLRIHRSTIVRIDAIREIQPFFGGEAVAVLHDGTKLKVGRTHRRKLKKFSQPSNS